MSKLPKAHKFFDLSDYGRSVARVIANLLKETRFTPIHVTIGFIVSGCMAIIFILNSCYWAAAVFLILKSVLDAADGELARIKKTPSYTGRYFDSVADIILNLLILISLWYVTDSSIVMMILAFIAIQLQGTLYNYYYVILRNNVNGDTTSRIFENRTPKAMPGESQGTVDLLFAMYKMLYGIFDRIVYLLDRKAYKSSIFPNWFMTIVSLFGLGFQLLIIAFMLVMGWKAYIIPFFVYYSFLIIVIIVIRKLL